jgi:xylulokinase
MDTVLGLDLGTTNCKAVLLDQYGQLVASATTPTPVRGEAPPAAGSPEYDADALWNTCAELIRRVTDQLRLEQAVVGVAVASMGEAGVLVDEAGKPLMPILTWHDRRTLPWVDWWRTRMSQADIYRITGLPLDHTYSANKLLWYRAQDLHAFARARTWLCLADWITFRLSGELSTSYSIASRTMLFDVRRHTWSDDLLRLAELPASLLPPALPSGDIVGRVTSQAARATGLPTGTPVVTGGHDHICAALAAGVIKPGATLNSTGTTDSILSTLEAPLLDEALADSGLCCGCHTVPDHYYLLGGFMSGAVVDWVSRLLAGDSRPDTLAGLMDEAASAPPHAHGIWFLPYLDGSGPPHRDPNAWGAWLGLRLTHTRGDVARATMEGLTFALRYLLEGFQPITGLTASRLRAVGGGSRNTWWQSLKADILGLPIEVPAMPDLTAAGAALLAGIGVGMFSDAADAAARSYRHAERHEPDPGRRAAYDTAYHDVFLKLYPALRELPL